MDNPAEEQLSVSTYTSVKETRLYNDTEFVEKWFKPFAPTDRLLEEAFGTDLGSGAFTEYSIEGNSRISLSEFLGCLSDFVSYKLLHSVRKLGDQFYVNISASHLILRKENSTYGGMSFLDIENIVVTIDDEVGVLRITIKAISGESMDICFDYDFMNLNRSRASLEDGLNNLVNLYKIHLFTLDAQTMMIQVSHFELLEHSGWFASSRDSFRYRPFNDVKTLWVRDPENFIQTNFSDSEMKGKIKCEIIRSDDYKRYKFFLQHDSSSRHEQILVAKKVPKKKAFEITGSRVSGVRWLLQYDMRREVFVLSEKQDQGQNARDVMVVMFEKLYKTEPRSAKVGLVKSDDNVMSYPSSLWPLRQKQIVKDFVEELQARSPAPLLEILEIKKPYRYDNETYTQYFGPLGACVASEKNVALVKRSSTGRVFSHAKKDDERFPCEYGQPLSAITAFAFALVMHIATHRNYYVKVSRGAYTCSTSCLPCRLRDNK